MIFDRFLLRTDSLTFQMKDTNASNCFILFLLSSSIPQISHRHSFVFVAVRIYFLSLGAVPAIVAIRIRIGRMSSIATMRNGSIQNAPSARMNVVIPSSVVLTCTTVAVRIVRGSRRWSHQVGRVVRIHHHRVVVIWRLVHVVIVECQRRISVSLRRSPQIRRLWSIHHEVTIAGTNIVWRLMHVVAVRGRRRISSPRADVVAVRLCRSATRNG
mmetsp:Transcript_28852/g.60037  ORF Transcript_28852/g.60037 Transcript_28852/m.60037 type:complete len:214 (+) Transcript_28852:109-750(+)